MNEQEQHIQQFLASSNYRQLSANQQKHAQDILTRFNRQMEIDQHLTDTTWTPEAVKTVMVGDFIADPALTNQFGIAVVPVLRAYQEFLQVDNLAEIVEAMEAQRTTMNECRKAHQTLAQLQGGQATTATEPAKEALKVEKWNQNNYADLVREVQAATETAPQFKQTTLELSELKYVLRSFLKLIVQEYREYPDEWTFANLQRVLGMMMPLDPEITPAQIKNIVPSATTLFDYLKKNDYIDLEHYRVGMKAVANMQPSEDMLASLERKERETQLVLSFINSNGINVDDTAAAEAWMDAHKQEVADFMRQLLNPWSAYERQQLQQQQREMQQRAKLGESGAKDPYLNRKKKNLQGIKFSKKARKRRKK